MAWSVEGKVTERVGEMAWSVEEEVTERVGGRWPGLWRRRLQRG